MCYSILTDTYTKLLVVVHASHRAAGVVRSVVGVLFFERSAKHASWAVLLVRVHCPGTIGRFAA
jgi:hypothetical protein